MSRLSGVWRERAACRDVPVSVFFPDEDTVGRSDRAALYETAKRVCAGCEVRALCLEHALRAGERHGCWGGESPRERAETPARRRALARRGLEAIGELRGVAS